MKTKDSKGYEAPKMLLESGMFSEGVLCTSGIPGGIGDYPEDNMTDYFN